MHGSIGADARPKKVAVRLVSGVVTLLVALVGVLVAAPISAQATPGPVVDRRGVTADSLPTVQIDGVVWRQLAVGNRVYVGGQFANARPAGAAPGTNQVPRQNFLAYNLTTGDLDTSFAPTFNGKVKSLAASADGSILYVGGAFTSVNGQPRSRFAAFNTSTGALLSMAPSFNSTINQMIVTPTAIFAGGLFSYVGSTRRDSLAAIRPSDGALLSWAPTTNGMVQALAMTPDGSRLVVGGNFTLVNNSDARSLASVSTSDGTLYPFAINQVVQNTGDSQSILYLQMDRDGTVYGGGYAYGGPGPFLEGVFAADGTTGAVKWIADCHGDTYDATRMGSAVYAVSHHHYCENIGGFPDTNPRNFWQRADAFTVEATGTNNPQGQGGYPDFGGQPAPSMVNWFPEMPSGTYTGQSQAGWTITSTDKYLLIGGEFPSVNGTRQQGLARFAVDSIAPKKMGPVISDATVNPTATALSSSRVRVKIPTNWDRDNETLSYELYREGTAAPIYATTAASTFWKRPTLSFDDTTLSAGSTVRYRVKVSDPDGNSRTTGWASVTVPSTVDPYLNAVADDNPDHYWRMGAAGTWPDLTGSSDLASSGTVTADSNGAVPGDPASSFSGSASSSSSSLPEPGPDTFTVEAWVKTTSTSGGKIVGFGDASAANVSGNYDRHIYMDNQGRLTFGVYPNDLRTISTSGSYNDGKWHQVVGTLSSSGMAFYVDGKRIGLRTDTTNGQGYTGRWRVGGDNLDGWPNTPASRFLNGSIDEVSVYKTALSLQQIQAHYTASGRTVDQPAKPTDAYGKAVYADEPDLQWRFNESTGAVATDTSPNGRDGNITGGVTLGASSPVAPGTAIQTNGSDGLVSTGTSVLSPNTYSSEIWFSSTTTTGGKLIGFGNQPSGMSSNYDRHVYMEPDGHLTFGLWAGGAYTISTPTAYNDGAWHQVVATQSPSGMTLYVDGVKIGTNPQSTGDLYNGYWRVGGDSPWSGNAYFAGSLDEAAVYSTALTLEQVRTHYRASVASRNALPIGTIADPVCTPDGNCKFSADTSDPDGTVAKLSWDFGDGSSPSASSNPTHRYDESGTYQVSLTITDDQGGEKVVTKSITATNSNQAPTASFTATTSGAAVSVDGSGSSDSDGSVAKYEWSFGDGESATGATASHTYTASGTYTVSLVVTDDDGAKSDPVTKSVTVSVPVPNQAPTASFTATTSGAAVSVDGSGSSDSDGSVAKYEWSFGDGESATGATASHTYAASGTYTVSLVVTDDDGAKSDPVTKSVTVAVNNDKVVDNFNRSVTRWGDAQVGGTYTYSNASYFSTNGSQGVINLPSAGAQGSAMLNSVSARDVDVRFSLKLDEAPTGAGPLNTFVVRSIDNSNDYRFTVQLHSDKSVRLNITKRVGGTSTNLGDVKVANLVYNPGDTLNVRLEAVGNGTTTLRSRVWLSGSTEPVNAQMTRTDSAAALQAPGGVGLVSYLSGSATKGTIVKIDDLKVIQP